MSQSIGLDIGHSAVKVAAGERFLFPAAACRAVALSVETADSAARPNTVTVGSTRYFVGETAVIHSGGQVLDGLNDDWIDTAEYQAIMLAGYLRAANYLGDDRAPVALGLPSRLHARQKERVRARAMEVLMLPRSKVSVLPQPLAALYGRLLDAKGAPAPAAGGSDARWYVVDIGYYTTDFGCWDHEVWSAAGQESMPGAYVAAQQVKRAVAQRYGMDIGMRDAEAILRNRSMRDQGKVIDLTEVVADASHFAAKAIIDRITQLFGERAIRGAAGVYVVGGGSCLMFEDIKAVWRHAVCASVPRFAVAEGLRRYSQATALIAA